MGAASPQELQLLLPIQTFGGDAEGLDRHVEAAIGRIEGHTRVTNRLSPARFAVGSYS